MKNAILKMFMSAVFGLVLLFTSCSKDEFFIPEHEKSPEAANQGKWYDIKICTEMHLAGESASEDRAIGVTSKFWTNGQTIKIKIIGGSTFVRAKVQHYANQWLNYANLKFLWVNSGDAEIRITFTPGGSWSYIGNDALYIPQTDPTMNFGWFDNSTSDNEFSRTTLHEFGHALGLVHEHQHPFHNIPWDRPALYKYYWDTNRWNPKTVDEQILFTYGTNGMSYTAFDAASIMEYAVPNSVTIGNYEIGWTSVLSRIDKMFIRGKYPFPIKTMGLNQFVSLKSYNIANNYVRHANWFGFIKPIFTQVDKLDATFKVVQGLDPDCPSCVSLESKNFPGCYLRHEYGRIKLAWFQNTATFKADASFYPMKGLGTETGFSFESKNYPGEFIRHRFGELWKDPLDNTALFKADASFLKTTPLAP